MINTINDMIKDYQQKITEVYQRIKDDAAKDNVNLVYLMQRDIFTIQMLLVRINALETLLTKIETEKQHEH